MLIFVSYHILWVQLEDMNMDEASEEVAVQLAAQGVIGKRVDEMESGFIMALDYMIELAEKDQDDKVLLFLVIFSFCSIDMDYSEPIFSCIELIITTFISTFMWDTFSNYWCRRRLLVYLWEPDGHVSSQDHLTQVTNMVL